MRRDPHAGRLLDRLFRGLCLSAVLLPLGLSTWLLARLLVDALGRLDWSFLSGFPSRRAEQAGILPGLVGSVSLVALTAVFTFPAGIGAAIYLEEYGTRGRIARAIETNIANLAGVPSVIYGLLGLGVFVHALGLGRSLLAGACTLSLLVLPMVILSAREALRAVPRELREACFAVGATRWQAIRRVVLPMALPGILTGSIRALSRAMGEAAPLIVVGALSYVAFVPDGAGAPLTALPLQIFDWVSHPQREFLANAAAAAVVLLALQLSLEVLALLVRSRLTKLAAGAGARRGERTRGSGYSC